VDVPENKSLGLALIMILDIFFNVGYAILSFFLRPLISQPDVTLSSDYATGFVQLFQFVSILNTFGTIMVVFFGAISLVIVAELAIFFYKGIMWIIKKIPFLNLK